MTGPQGGDVSGLGPDSLSYPQGVAVDGAGRLYVADSSNHRVLEFDNPLVSQIASRVFGQGDSFTTSTCADGYATDPAPSADGLCAPEGVAVDNAINLYVADTGNNRLLIYESRSPRRPRPPPPRPPSARPRQSAPPPR